MLEPLTPYLVGALIVAPIVWYARGRFDRGRVDSAQPSALQLPQHNLDAPGRVVESFAEPPTPRATFAHAHPSHRHEDVIDVEPEGEEQTYIAEAADLAGRFEVESAEITDDGERIYLTLTPVYYAEVEDAEVLGPKPKKAVAAPYGYRKDGTPKAKPGPKRTK